VRVRGVRRAFLDARILCLLKALPRAPLLSPHLPYTCAVGSYWQVFKHYWSRNGAMPFDGPCLYSWIPVAQFSSCKSLSAFVFACSCVVWIVLRSTVMLTRVVYAPHGACLRLGVSHVDQTACISRVGSLI
jgi:hypothetical protein